MIARVAIGAALMLAASGYSGTLAQSRGASDALLGRWDLVVQRGTQTSPSWLEVERSGTATLVGNSWDQAAARGRSPRSSSPTARSASPSRHNGKAIPATSPSRDGSRAIGSRGR